MNPTAKTLLCGALALCLALGLAPATFAQSVTTGALAGLVTDQDGSTALPGAVVNAVHEPTGTRYSVVTDAAGRFRILNVRVGGPYTVTVTMDGFREQSTSDVLVQLGETVELTFQLQLETIEETVYVVGESTALINPSRSGSSSNIYTEALESLPSIRRSLDDFTRTNPFFTVAANNDGPEVISAGGRNSQYNNISIDGSVNNDLFGLSDGGTPGGQSGTTPISLDAIQEVQVVLSSFDVRQGGFTGGSINAVTRSGTNDFKGSLFYYTRDDSFFGDGPDELGEIRGFEEDQYGFRIGGPLSRDKIFFFLNADIEERVRPSGWSLDGSSGQAFANGNLVNEAMAFRSYLMNTYGFDPGGLGEDLQDDPSDKYFGRLDFNLSDAHNLTLRHNYVDAARDVNFPGSFTYEWPSEAYDFQTETNSTVGQLNSVFSSTMFNELRLSYQTIRDRRAGRDGVTFPWIEIEDVNGSASGTNEFEAGTEPFSTKNALDQDIVEINNDFTWIKGNHTFTFGTHNELFTFENLFIQNAFGAYEYANLDTFLSGGNARRFAFTVVPPGQPETQMFDVNQLGLYVGDQWAVRDNLTLTYGLRVDAPFFPDEPTRNPFTETTFGYRTDELPDGELLWQPRIGFNWDVENNGKSQLRGGGGIFAGRAPYVWISNNYARTGVEQIFITCFNVPFNPDPFGQTANCTTGGTIGEFNLIDPDFQLPQVVRLNLGYDRELPWLGLTGSVEVIRTDSLEEIDYQNVNIRQTGALTFDGRPVYSRISSADGAYLITNTGEGEATQLALKLERPFRNGTWGYVSYAWTDAEVVNEGTSSRAVSNWTFQEGLDPNNVETSISDFEVEHRFSASFSHQFNRQSSYPTTVSLFYNLQSGRPFAYLLGSDFAAFNNGASYNGDGTDANDLFFVPATANDVFVTTGQRDSSGSFVEDPNGWALLDAFINAHPVLDDHRGEVVPRNTDNAPWNHTLDLHLAQAIPVGFGSLELTLDVLNLVNLIDEDSGTSRFVLFNTVELAEIEGFAADGRPIYNLANVVRNPDSNPIFTTHNLNSRWRAKVGLRWTF